jgi:tetratricopeptide (TPR) repeat protein
MINLRVNLLRFVILSLLCTKNLFFSCATTPKANDKAGEQGSSGGDGDGQNSGSGGSESGSLVSQDRKFLTTSLSHNGFTSKTISRSKASDLSNNMAQSRSKDPQTAYGTIVANRLSGKSAQESFDEARRVMDHLLSKNPDAELPEAIQLELALSALQTNRLALAEHFLDKLVRSKNPKVKVASINAIGVIAIRTDRVPEAMATFKEAINVEKDFEPALLNIGFLALQGGDVATAKRALGSLQDDWFVDAAYIAIDRVDGDGNKAEQRCERVLSKHPRHKPTLINCGINSYQGLRDYKRARDYFNKALAVQGGPAAWDEKTGKLLGVVDSEEMKAQRDKQMREAEERKAKAEADKAKVDQSGAKAQDAVPASPPPK